MLSQEVFPDKLQVYIWIPEGIHLDQLFILYTFFYCASLTIFCNLPQELSNVRFACLVAFIYDLDLVHNLPRSIQYRNNKFCMRFI